MTSTSTAGRSTYIVLGIGILAVSFAAILIRYAQLENIPSMYIAAFRLLGAAALLTPITLWRHGSDIRQLGRDEWLLAGISGLFLALHFAAWTLSLAYTTVLVSVTLVTTTPIWTAILEWVFLRQAPRRVVVIGMVIAVGGGALLGIPVEGMAATPPAGNNFLLGGTLAILGAIAVAVYFTIGRKLRAGLSLLPYIWIVYSIAGLLFVPVLWVQGVALTGYSTAGYLWLVALAVVPQVIGHSALNYAVKYLTATYISVLIKLEPVLSAIVAYFTFAEIPNRWELIGSGVILLGVLVASWQRQTLPKRLAKRRS